MLPEMPQFSGMDNLSGDVLLEVFIRLESVRDVAKCRLVCKKFANVIDTAHFWSQKTLRDFNLSPGAMRAWRQWNPMDVYQCVLHKLRGAAALWRRNDTYYGGLLRIRFDEMGVCCYELQAPPCTDFLVDTAACHKLRSLGVSLPGMHDEIKLRQRLLWRLHPVDATSVALRCFFSSSTGHELSRTTVETLRNLSSTALIPWMAVRRAQWVTCFRGFTMALPSDINDNQCTVEFECTSCERVPFLDFLAMEHGLSLQNVAHENRDIVLKIFSGIFSKKLCGSARPWSDVLPRPGIYAGTYGVHGWELLHLRESIVDHRVVLSLDKITGDSNVAAGQKSVEVVVKQPDFEELHAGFDFAEDEFHDRMVEHRRLQGDPESYWQHARRRQFQMGSRYYCKAEHRIRNVKTCWLPLGGRGRISTGAHLEPSDTPVVLAALDRHSFTVRWPKLLNVSLFCWVDA